MEEEKQNQTKAETLTREEEIAALKEKLNKIHTAASEGATSPGEGPAKNQAGIPLIKTLESDIGNRMTEGVDPLGQGESSEVFLSAQKSKTRTKVVMILVTLFVFLGLASAAGFYFFNKNKKVEAPAPIQVKRYFIGDVWPKMDSATLKNSTADATSTNDFIIINVVDFEKTYSHLIKNENLLEGVAKEKFSYSNLGSFQDAKVENIDMRIADCNEGPIIYGYKDKTRLIIANDLGKYLKLYKSL